MNLRSKRNTIGVVTRANKENNEKSSIVIKPLDRRRSLRSKTLRKPKPSKITKTCLETVSVKSTPNPPSPLKGRKRKLSYSSSKGRQRTSNSCSRDSSSFFDNESMSVDDQPNDLRYDSSQLNYSIISKTDKQAKKKHANNRKIELNLEMEESMDESASVNESILNQSLSVNPRKQILEICKQHEIISFDSYFLDEAGDDFVKIGEGVYGEVFRVLSKHTVIKIFPVGGKELVNGEEQMSYSDVYPELFVSSKLTSLSYQYTRNRSFNFIQMKKSTLVQGKLPKFIVEKWYQYQKKCGSDNECLEFLPADQEWLILEFDFGGVPLSTFRFNSCLEAKSVFEQIALSLAAAEIEFQFEHRDLHWNNILIRPTKSEKLLYKVNGVRYSVFTYGLRVSIIDFTVSRISVDKNVVYVDMSDSPEIFEGEGDYQMEIYRMMRDLNNHKWKEYHPVTNLYWLHYLLDKMLNETVYPRRDPDMKPIESELRALYDTLLSSDYAGCKDFVEKNFYFDNCRSI